jgi:uncharacterized repeat protein (TIGR01451 family)
LAITPLFCKKLIVFEWADIKMKIKLNKIVSKYVLLAPVFLLAAVITHTGYAENLQAAPTTKSQQTDPLLIVLSSQKIDIDKNGKESFSNADKVKPGEMVQYKAIYHNRGKTNLSGLKASLPIPFGMNYVEKSAHPASVLATVDNVTYGVEPLMRSVKDKDGKDKQETVPYAEYQSLRWEVGTLDAGKKIQVTARMRVNQLPKSAAELVSKSTVQVIKK